MNDNLGLIVFDNIKEIGDKVNAHLQELRGNNNDYIVPMTASRFANGEGKVRIEESVREKDLYILSAI